VRKVWKWLLVVSVVGFVASIVMDMFIDDYKDYGEVPIPGSQRLHLPAGDVVVSFHAEMPGANEGERTDPIPKPQNLELVITPPSGVAQPSVTEKIGSGTADNSDVHRPMKVVHIPAAGDYTIATNAPEETLRFTLDGKVRAFVNPRLSFGHDSPFGFLPWLFGGLFVVGLVGGGTTFYRGLRSPSDAEPPISGPELLALGQRVRGVLKSFTATGETARSRGLTPSRPEFLDYPYYALVVELQLPNQAPVIGRNRQPIPPTEVPNLAIGRELNCAVDPADPSGRFAVDWTADSANPQKARIDFTQPSGELEHPPAGNSWLTVFLRRYGRRPPM
jgi:hypothetical protein